MAGNKFQETCTVLCSLLVDHSILTPRDSAQDGKWESMELDSHLTIAHTPHMEISVIPQTGHPELRHPDGVHSATNHHGGLGDGIR